MRFFVSEKSTLASIRVRKPAVPIIPKRSMVTPPITAVGMDMIAACKGLNRLKTTAMIAAIQMLKVL